MDLVIVGNNRYLGEHLQRDRLRDLAAMAVEDVHDDHQSLRIPILGAYLKRTVIFVSFFPPSSQHCLEHRRGQDEVRVGSRISGVVWTLCRSLESRFGEFIAKALPDC